MLTSKSSYLLYILLLVASRPTAGENLVASGQFDRAADINSWRVSNEGGQAAMTFEAAPDESACNASGSALLITDTPGTFEMEYSVCANGLVGGNEYAFGLEVLFGGGESDGALHWGVTLFAGTDCTGAYAGDILLGPVGYSPEWQKQEFWVTTPVEAVSARVEVRVSSLGAPQPLQLNLDRVFVRPVADLFADGFEVGEICRWSQI